ncbi:MAG: putative inorganic carbon transporter subunit DabA [Bacteroidota bacterium]
MKALDSNAKERSRRFESINTKLSPEKIHAQVLRRSVSLFEPRPKLNHATNALCIVGRRVLSKKLFLDRRVFTNSVDYQVDPDGKYLFNILKAAAPVCGGINRRLLAPLAIRLKLDSNNGLSSWLPFSLLCISICW